MGMLHLSNDTRGDVRRGIGDVRPCCMVGSAKAARDRRCCAYRPGYLVFVQTICRGVWVSHLCEDHVSTTPWALRHANGRSEIIVACWERAYLLGLECRDDYVSISSDRQQVLFVFMYRY